MKRLSFLFSFIVILAGITSAQITVSLSDVTLNANGGNVSVPITVTGFNNIGAISLRISYDPNVLTFDSLSNPHGEGLISNASNGEISIGWFSPDGKTPINYGDDKLVDLNFTHSSGSSNLTFITNACEIADTGKTIFNNITYHNGKVDAPPGGGAQKVEVGGFVWLDKNKDGKHDSGEETIGWVTIHLYDCSGAPILNIDGNGHDYILTDNKGEYKIQNLEPGSYYVQFMLGQGFENKEFTPNFKPNDPGSDSYADSADGKTECITLNAGEKNLSINAGLCEKDNNNNKTGSIGNKVWNDVNANGIHDSGENGLQGVTVNLIDCSTDSVIKTSLSDGDGNYSFDSLAAGSYKVEFVLLAGYVFSPKNAVSDTSADSDVNEGTGETDCTNLASNQHVTSIDAGMHVSGSTAACTLGDFVWKDLNDNGIQDTGEPGIANITVKLLDCDGQLIKTTTTNSAGNYLFDNLDAGSYKLKFINPGNLVFAKQYQSGEEFDSDADESTGETDCITLTGGSTNLTIDAGMKDKPSCGCGTPEPWITKDDSITVMVDSGKTVTYTIKYGNKGTAELNNVTITDSLPDGLTYVSSSSGAETRSGSNVIVFNIGTIPANSDAQVTLSAEVTSSQSDYLNTVCLKGYDSNSACYEECDTDLDVANDCSTGGGAGVESRGDMAELLLKRQLKIQYGMTSPIVAKKGAASISSMYNLSDLIPSTGPLGSHPVETTPFDILGISNASASYAADYNIRTLQGDKRVGGVFATITAAPFIYDHTKVVCDRLTGSDVDEVTLVDINGYQFYAAKLSNEKEKVTDYAISFSVYETAGGYKVQNKWTYEEYIAPNGASSVYNFQIWTPSYQTSVNLVKDILAKFASLNKVTYLNVTQVNPSVFIKSSQYTHDGNVSLTIENAGSAREITVSSRFRVAQGADQISTSTNVVLQKGENKVEMPLGIISDANLFINEARGFKDEVFVSGGAYTYINGPNSSVSSLSTANYPKQDISNYPAGALVLSGGAAITGQLNDWVSLIRSLTANNSAYDLSKYNKIRFEASGTGTVTLIFNMANTVNYNYYSLPIELTAANKIYNVSFSQLHQLNPDQVKFDAAQIKDVGFIINKTNNPTLSNYNFEVKNIAFLADDVTAVNKTQNLPTEFSLTQNYPNPFNPSTVIEFSLPQKENVALNVYNILGQHVATLFNGEAAAGKHSITFDAGKLTSGIYFYRITGNSINVTKKMILAK